MDTAIARLLPAFTPPHLADITLRGMPEEVKRMHDCSHVDMSEERLAFLLSRLGIMRGQDREVRFTSTPRYVTRHPFQPTGDVGRAPAFFQAREELVAFARALEAGADPQVQARANVLGVAGIVTVRCAAPEEHPPLTRETVVFDVLTHEVFYMPSRPILLSLGYMDGARIGAKLFPASCTPADFAGRWFKLTLGADNGLAEWVTIPVRDAWAAFVPGEEVTHG